MADSLIDKMRETAQRYALFTPGQTVVVAVSGGPDSVALLHALHSLRDEWGLSLVAAHLDHGFRGAESAADAAYVEELCEKWVIPVHLAFEDVPALKKQTHLSAQEAARKARHAFLRQTAAEVGAERIALGHTRNDRVETILINLLRGTGLEGLGGFLPVNLPLVRPLYEVSRQEVLDYCAANHLQPRVDSSNAKLDYRRNRLRTELLPYLAAYYNERVEDALLRMAELASADNLLLEHLAEEALSQILVEHSSLQIVLNAHRLNAHPQALRRRILRQAIARLRGSLHDIRFETLENVLSASETGQKVALELPASETGSFAIRCEGDRLIVFRRAALAEILPWRVSLPIPGQVMLPHSEIVLEMAVCPDLEAVRNFIQQRTEEVSVGNLNILVFPLSELKLPLTARSWQAGDRMRPRGMTGRKKLQDIFTDRKIPREQRALFAVIAEAEPDSEEETTEQETGRILAVLGAQISEMALQLKDITTEPQKNGPFLLLVALSPRTSS